MHRSIFLSNPRARATTDVMVHLFGSKLGKHHEPGGARLAEYKTE